MKIGVNCGHTIAGPGTGAAGILQESVENRYVGRELMRLLAAGGAEVVDCTIDRAGTQGEYLAMVTELANRQDLDWFVSVHFNASPSHAGRGVEVYTYGGRQYPDAVDVCGNIAALGFKNRGVKPGTGLYVIRKTKAKSMLVEVCFCDNADDVALYRRHGCGKVAQAIHDALCAAGAVGTAGTPLMGESVLTEGQIVAWMRHKAATKPAMAGYMHLPKLFLEEGAAEGYRGDLAFCQAVKETGYFGFGGDVVPGQHNYAGLGTTGGGVKGCSFPDDRTGIRAQVQHGKGYATDAPLNNPCVDPRYGLISPHGKAKTVEELGGKWAVPGYDTKKYASLQEASAAQDSYGHGILSVYREIASFAEGAGRPPEEPGTFYVVSVADVWTREQAEQERSRLAAMGVNGVVHKVKAIG